MIKKEKMIKNLQTWIGLPDVALEIFFIVQVLQRPRLYLGRINMLFYSVSFIIQVILNISFISDYEQIGNMALCLVVTNE